MSAEAVRIEVAEPLRFFIPARRRGPYVAVPYDGTSTVGHLISSIGVPLPEVGRLRVDGKAVTAAHRPERRAVISIEPVSRPQSLPTDRPRFVLDVHLGSLARRLRLLGIDTWYDRGVDDDELVRIAQDEDHFLLTQDRGLLHRASVRDRAAYVRGAGATEQLDDVLDRFDPPTAPFTRCLRCNGPLAAVSKQDVLPLLEAGTARSYDDFVRCQDCARVYWRGAHAQRLDALVAAGTRAPTTSTG
jgi:uncharacterized protein with PIN domain